MVKANCRRASSSASSPNMSACSLVQSHMLVPMSRDVNAARNPHFVATSDVFDESPQRSGEPRTTGKKAVQYNRQHLGRANPALLVKDVEAVAQIGKELIARVEALSGGEAHVIRIQRIGHD